MCYDDENRKVRLSLRQAEILEALAADEKLKEDGGGVPDIARGKPKYVFFEAFRLKRGLMYR